MLEVEVKAKLFSENVREKLLQLGASFVKKEKQIDIYFNHPCREFGSRDEALRKRKIKGCIYLTYKGPKIDEKTKTREEIEVKVEGDEGEVHLLLKKLGFTPLQKIVKEREFYNWQNLKVCVDRVEGLGNFLEIEGKGLEDREKIFKLLDKLNIPLSSLTRDSYLEIIMKGEKE